MANITSATTDFMTSHGDVITHHNDSHAGGHAGGVHVVLFDFHNVAQPAIVVMFILVAMLLKLGFHYASFLSSKIPESCLLIVAGCIFGGILKAAGMVHMFPLEPHTFFLFLLPPIVLDSAYSLHDRVFIDNLGSVLTHAVIGTILNFILIGPTLYGLAQAGAMGDLDIGLVECLLFASLIVAVDPVAVLAVFQEIGVNNVLYFMVFGESLLNDGVTIVLSNMMKAFVEFETVPTEEIFIGIASFFTISLGGLFIGLLFGILTAFLTQITTHVRVVEPMAVLVMGYASYLAAEMFHWSGIISAIGCGLIQAEYSFHNVSRKSHITIDYTIKMISNISDTIIFLFLGIELVNTDHDWQAGFILWTLFFCLLYRFIVTFGLNFILNKASATSKLNLEEQFIMWYGGLRGAVCFAICSTISDNFRYKNMFLTTTLMVILFTVFIQGSTIKPLVTLCRIKLKDESDTVSMFEELSSRVTDNIMYGVEVITHFRGANYIRALALHYNEKYLQRWFQKDPVSKEEQLVEDYANLLLRDYEENIQKAYFDPKGDKTKFYNTPSVHDSDAEVNPMALKLEHRAKNPVGENERKSVRTDIRRNHGSHIKRSFRRQRTFKDIILRKEPEEVDEPGLDDLKQILKSHNSKLVTRHQKFDRNLLRDDSRDLEHCLHEKRMRTDRHRRTGVFSLNDHESMLGTTQRVDLRRRKNGEIGKQEAKNEHLELKELGRANMTAGNIV